ncbi:MAG: DUF1294 domain-containing protein [Clostridiales bacterium]|nr:DUF1294 domain-containing protein [Clostridiales bacterium]
MNGLLGRVLPLYLVAANVVTFLLYGLDKAKARRGAWRISERTLLTAAFAGGCVGALLGMQLFRHKTRHRTFQILVSLACVLWVAILVLLWRG